MIPEPTPEQALRVLKILGEWMKRNYEYQVIPEYGREQRVRVEFSDPDVARDQYAESLVAYGANHFDAICQATTAMAVLLEVSVHATGDQ